MRPGLKNKKRKGQEVGRRSRSRRRWKRSRLSIVNTKPVRYKWYLLPWILVFHGVFGKALGQFCVPFSLNQAL